MTVITPPFFYDIVTGNTPAYRWDKPGSSYYNLRPDRLLPAIRKVREVTTYGSAAQLDFIQRLGAPLTSSPSSTAVSGRAESRKPAKTQSAHGFRPGKAPAARGKCPKGHYWSYKKKKCVKSKFR